MQPQVHFRAALGLILAVWCATAPRAMAQAGSVQFKYAAYSVKESAPAAVITVMRLGGSAGTVSVDFETRHYNVSDATPEVDYLPTNGTLTFGPGVTSLTFTVPILKDAVYELDEKVTLELSNLVGPGATIGGQQNATLTIVDDDVCAYALVPTGRTHEAEGGTGEFAVNATEGCFWTVTKADTANWVAVVMTPSGIGTNHVSYSVDPNPLTASRSAVLKIAGKSFTITQRGKPPPDLTRPTIVISSPVSGARVTNLPVTVTGTAGDAGGVALVEARLESAVGTNGYQSVEGTSVWAVDLFGVVPGLNTIRVRAQDSAGNYSAEVTRAVKFVVVNPLALEIEGNGTVAGARDGQFLDVGKAYTLTATPVPARENLFAEWAGELRTAAPRITFQMQTNLHLIARFVSNPFIAVKGAYNGLFQDEAPVRHESSGFFTATTTDRGAFSAKVTLAGKVIAFTGKFALDGWSTNLIVRPGLNPITVKLQLHLDEADEITGTLNDGNWAATLRADRATFNSTANPAPAQGKYTLLLAGHGDAELAPHGFSFGTVNVDAAGRLSLAGTLADGSVLTQKVPLAKDGRWPLFGRLYAGAGAILGWLKFEEGIGDDLNGSVTWIKPPLSASRFYTNGFTFSTNASGARYATPAPPATPLLDFTDGLGVVGFSGGNVNPDFASGVRLDPGNKIVDLGTNKLAFAIVASSGLFHGTVNVPGTTRRVSFKGALNTKAGYGAGFFTGTNQGGRVVLQAAP